MHERYRRSTDAINNNEDMNHDPTRCRKNKTYVWCLQSDYNKEKHPFTYFHLMNKTLPLNYDFKFVIDEISNINDKAQVKDNIDILFQIQYLA